MALWEVCDRLKSELSTERCILVKGHSGYCRSDIKEKPVDWDQVFKNRHPSNLSRD